MDLNGFIAIIAMYEEHSGIFYGLFQYIIRNVYESGVDNLLVINNFQYLNK